MKLILILATAAVLVSACAPSQSAEQDQDLMMFLQNATDPFVTRDFALRLGQLVMSQKYQVAVLAAEPPEVIDKGDTWWVTFTIARWNTPPQDAAMEPRQVTVRIRKKDAAIVSIK